MSALEMRSVSTSSCACAVCEAVQARGCWVFSGHGGVHSVDWLAQCLAS